MKLIEIVVLQLHQKQKTSATKQLVLQTQNYLTKLKANGKFINWIFEEAVGGLKIEGVGSTVVAFLT